MRKLQKNILYENIMRNVAKTVRKSLNEEQLLYMPFPEFKNKMLMLFEQIKHVVTKFTEDDKLVMFVYSNDNAWEELDDACVQAGVAFESVSDNLDDMLRPGIDWVYDEGDSYPDGVYEYRWGITIMNISSACDDYTELYELLEECLIDANDEMTQYFEGNNENDNEEDDENDW